MILRDWQQEAFSNYNQALRQGTRSLLWEAAPGAGKTNAALAVCRDQLHRRGRRRVIVVHNHPSGDPTPSPEDVRVTREMIRAGALLSITLLDHLIIGKQKFVSLKERGMGLDF